jgi:hypothetical protein
LNYDCDDEDVDDDDDDNPMITIMITKMTLIMMIMISMLMIKMMMTMMMMSIMMMMMIIRLVLGELEGIPVVIMQGRFHSYEGYDLWQVCNFMPRWHTLDTLYLQAVMIMIPVIPGT